MSESCNSRFEEEIDDSLLNFGGGAFVYIIFRYN